MVLLKPKSYLAASLFKALQGLSVLLRVEVTLSQGPHHLHLPSPATLHCGPPLQPHWPPNSSHTPACSCLVTLDLRFQGCSLPYVHMAFSKMAPSPCILPWPCHLKWWFPPYFGHPCSFPCLILAIALFSIRCITKLLDISLWCSSLSLGSIDRDFICGVHCYIRRAWALRPLADAQKKCLLCSGRKWSR